MPSFRRVRPIFVALLLGVAAWWSTDLIRRSRAPAEILAYTTCPFRGEPSVVIRRGLAPGDSQPVLVHEQVHASQCRTLGPMAYRLRNLTADGKLSLELPAYCAAANTRAALGVRPDIVRARMLDDMQAAFSGLIDSAVVIRSVREGCRVLGQPWPD